MTKRSGNMVVFMSTLSITILLTYMMISQSPVNSFSLVHSTNNRGSFVNTKKYKTKVHALVSAKDIITFHKNNSLSETDVSAPYYQIQIPPFHSPSSSSSPSSMSSSNDHQQEGYPSLLHSIYLQPSFLSVQEATHCLSLVQGHANTTQAFQKGKNNDRHVNYATVDFPLHDCHTLHTYLMNTLSLKDKLFHLYTLLYNLSYSDLEIEDIFLVHYEAKGNDNDPRHDDKSMDRLEAHRDGTLLSFTIPLTSANTFQGGGTFFEALRYVHPTTEYSHFFLSGGVLRVQHAGDLIIHCGKLLHGGNVVTHGQRTVLVGFVHVHDTCTRQGVLAKACRNWGRMDVAKIYGQRWAKRKFHNRQQEQNRQESRDTRTKEMMMMMRRRNNSNVEKSQRIQTCTSCIRTQNIPTSLLVQKLGSSILKRSDEQYQRIQRLAIEDILLRDILLPRQRVSSIKKRRPIRSHINKVVGKEKENKIPTSTRFLEDFTIL